MKRIPFTLLAVLALVVATPVIADEIGPGRSFDDGPGSATMTAMASVDDEGQATLEDTKEETSLLDYFMNLIK